MLQRGAPRSITVEEDYLSDSSIDRRKFWNQRRWSGLYRNRLIWTSCFEPFSMSCNISHKEHHA